MNLVLKHRPTYPLGKQDAGPTLDVLLTFYEERADEQKKMWVFGYFTSWWGTKGMQG